MSSGATRKDFASRPGDLDRWIRSAADSSSKRCTAASGFTARLTIDVTPELRGRIKVVAFQRGTTVAEMLRDLLDREFPANEGAAR